ncbi:hypothetical protein AAFF_G00133250 [Aldrovandia affinis]|uniref:Uncharacterized protein n=1 Tax=Aldrovandia affinis TaxID=143900 RepID=A0AAD7RQE9_9TELE|nr:hypothetical protein AAFF_G00133250 [Aldrovandia affinis]
MKFRGTGPFHVKSGESVIMDSNTQSHSGWSLSRPGSDLRGLPLAPTCRTPRPSSLGGTCVETKGLAKSPWYPATKQRNQDLSWKSKVPSLLVPWLLQAPGQNEALLD